MKKKIAALLGRLKGYAEQAATLKALAADEQGRDYTPDEAIQLEGWAKEASEVRAELERLRKIQADEDSLELAAADAAQVEDDSATPTNYRQVQGRHDSTPRWRGLGEFAQAVAAASQPGGRMDPRLRVQAATGLSEGVTSDGGFLVTMDMATELSGRLYGATKVWSRARDVPISSGANGLKLNLINETSRASTRWGGILAYWLAEAAAKTESKPAFRQIDLNLKKLVGLCYATDELLQDVAALESVLTQGFLSEFAFRLDDAAINGTGVGQPLGVLNAGCTISVAKETGQAAATIVSDNVFKMYAAMPADSMSTAVWFLNVNCWPQLFKLSVTVGTGGVPVFVPGGGINAAPFGTLLGRPIIPIEQCATLGTVGDIIFADMQQYQTISKGGAQAASSIHLKFNYDETTFRWVLRVDGQPIWNAALTPFKGAASSISPFVTLAVRA